MTAKAELKLKVEKGNFTAHHSQLPVLEEVAKLRGKTVDQIRG